MHYTLLVERGVMKTPELEFREISVLPTSLAHSLCLSEGRGRSTADCFHTSLSLKHPLFTFYSFSHSLSINLSLSHSFALHPSLYFSLWQYLPVLCLCLSLSLVLLILRLSLSLSAFHYLSFEHPFPYCPLSFSLSRSLSLHALFLLFLMCFLQLLCSAIRTSEA